MPLDEGPLLLLPGDPSSPELPGPPSSSFKLSLLFPQAMNTGTRSEHPTTHLKSVRMRSSKPVAEHAVA
jgi:hypothetical protein